MQSNSGSSSGSGPQAEQLNKLIAAANAGQLSQEQMNQLRVFLQGRQSQSQQQSQQHDGVGVMQQQPIPQPQPQPTTPGVGAVGTSTSASTAASTSNTSQQMDARTLISSMNQKITNIEQVLSRHDINEMQRNRLQGELDTTRRNVAAFMNQVKQAAQAQAQAQQMQQQQQQGYQQNQAQKPSANELQAAQQRAMAQKADLLQRQMLMQQQQLQQHAQMPLGNVMQGIPQQQPSQQANQMQPHQRQLSNQQQPQANLTFPPAVAGQGNNLRRSPNLQAQQIPMQQQQQQQQHMQQQQQQQHGLPNHLQSAANVVGGSPAMSAASPPSDQKPRILASGMHQPGPSSQGGRGTPIPANASQQQQMQHVAISQAQMAGRPASAASNQSGAQQINETYHPSNSRVLHTTENLNMPSYTAEIFPPARPTINAGVASNPIVGTPAITKPPDVNLPNSGRPGSSSGMHTANNLANDPSSAASMAATPQTSTSGTSGIPQSVNLGQPGPLALKNTEGRPYNKRKLGELLHSIDPTQVLDAQVEDLLLEVADEFVDSITKFACRLAKHRKSDRLECKDLNLVLEKTYNMQVPGFGSDEVKQGGLARRQNLPAYASRLAAVREAKARRV